jgi:hypothetical protein
MYYSKDSYLNYERGGVFDKFRLSKSNICHQTIFYPKAVYISVKYNVKYRLFADWEYNMRCFKQGKRFIHINEKIAFYDETGVSITQTDILFEQDFKEIVLNNLGLLSVIYLGCRKVYKKFQINLLWK